MRHLASTDKPVHIETHGCIINIRPGLHDADGNQVTSVEVLCDQGWVMPDLHKSNSINVRVVKAQ